MVQLEEELAIKPHNLHLAPATHIGEGEKSLTSCPCLTPATHVGEGEKTLTRCPSAFLHAPWHMGTHIYINTHAKLYKSEKI